MHFTMRLMVSLEKNQELNRVQNRNEVETVLPAVAEKWPARNQKASRFFFRAVAAILPM